MSVAVIPVDSIRPPIRSTPREQANPTQKGNGNDAFTLPLLEPVVVDSIRPIPEPEDDSG
jgi:hypothetical protein